MKGLALVLLAGLLAGPLPIAAQDPFFFTKIVDTATPVPGGLGVFDPPLAFFNLVADQGDVLFIGRTTTGEGLYRYRRGQLLRVVDTTTLYPGTASPFSSFSVADMEGDQIVFVAAAHPGLLGVLSDDGSGPSVLVDRTDTIPDTAELFDWFFWVDLHQGEVAFSGGNEVDNATGIYATAGGLHTLVDTSFLIPGTSDTFPAFGSFGADDNGFAFSVPRPNISLDDGIYRDLGNGLEVVADLSTPIPGGSGSFTAFTGQRMVYSDGSVAFNGEGSGSQSGIYSDSGGSLQRIADISTTVPGTATTFVSFSNPLSFTDGIVVFIGLWLPSNLGAFAWIDGELLPILQRGDLLDGKEVFDLTPSRFGIDRTIIALRVFFTDGTEAVYLAERPLHRDGFESGDLTGWTASVQH